MSGWCLYRRWLCACCLFAAGACQDRPLNLLSDSLPTAGAGGAAEPTAGSGDVAGTFVSAGAVNSGAGQTGAGNAGGGGASGQGGFDPGGAGDTRSSSAGAAGSAGTGGSGGTACLTDADCAPPIPGCSPTEHVCKQCSKSSHCPNGQPCSIDDGECGN